VKKESKAVSKRQYRSPSSGGKRRTHLAGLDVDEELLKTRICEIRTIGDTLEEAEEVLLIVDASISAHTSE